MMYSLVQYMPSARNVNMNESQTKSWILEVVESKDNPEELMLEFPQDFLDTVGWKEGDILEWQVEGEQIFLSKKQ